MVLLGNEECGQYVGRKAARRWQQSRLVAAIRLWDLLCWHLTMWSCRPGLGAHCPVQVLGLWVPSPSSLPSILNIGRVGSAGKGTHSQEMERALWVALHDRWAGLCCGAQGKRLERAVGTGRGASPSRPWVRRSWGH